MADMNGKVALVTGASSGIGRETAKAFAARGCRVVLGARRENELAAVAAEIEAQGGEVAWVKTDVAVAGDVERLVDYAVAGFGRLDYAANNAGIEGELGGIADLSEEAFDRVIRINLKGVFLCMKHQSRAMLAAGNGGAIVNVGSINSFLGFPGGAAYATSKHGLVGLTSCVSAELAPQGIRVNLVCPGIIDTPMHQRARGLLGDAVYDELIETRIHLRRAGKPEEIARSIVFLCSDEASYITGATLAPDGGFLLTI